MSRPKPSVLRTLKQELPRGKRLLLAVSGGVDSVVLLHGCLTLAHELQNQIEVAHVDHGLRRASKKDAAFVAELAERAGCKFHLCSLRPPIRRSNLEAWGRAERYTFFAGVLCPEGPDILLTAHSANDAAETFLIKLVSNKELTPIHRCDPERWLLRPLLSVTRAEINKYAKEHKLAFREDESNRDERFLRNRIRAKLLPLLAREFDPRIVETLSERAVAAGEDLECLSALARAQAGELSRHAWGSKPWLREARGLLASVPVALQWRIVEALLLAKVQYPLGRRHATKAVHFLLGTATGLELPGKFKLQRKGGGVQIR